MRAVEWDAKVGGFIECQVDPEPPNGAVRIDKRTDFAEAAVRQALHEVMAPVTTCVTATSSVRRLRALLFSRDLDAVPVVDAQLKVLGVVSRADLLGSALDASVEEVTPSKLHALPEHAPVAFAIALMAFERVNQVPVVTDDGELVGMWDATAALRWTAERMGYVCAAP